MIEVKEYVDESGISPYARWHNRLNARAAVKVSTALYRLELGNFSNTKGVGGDTKNRQRQDINAAKIHWQDYKARKRQSE